MSGGKATNGIIEYSGANTPGWVSNLGLSLSGGVLSVVDAQGAALTPANPGWVTVKSTTGGLLKSLKVTDTLFFNDDANASSDLTNLGFGITETVDWAQDVPFYLYVANKSNLDIDTTDGSSVFFIARNPTFATTPSSADDIGDIGAIPVNDSQNVILIMADVTVANYTSLPCQLIGCFRMQWSTTTDDWTVQSLGAADGLSQEALDATFKTRWTFPLGQNGAASGTYLHDNGGTAPVFTTNEYYYTMDRYGFCSTEIYLNGDGGTDGAGAVQSSIALPYYYTNGITTLNMYIGYTIAQTTITSNQVLRGVIASNGRVADLTYLNSSAVITDVQNGFYTNGTRTLSCSIRYKAF